MSGVRPEPLALEVAFAHYVASMPEGKTVTLKDIAEDFGCEVKDIKAAYESVIEVEDRDLAIISDIEISDDGTRLVKYGKGGYERGFSRRVRLSPVQLRAALLAIDLVSGISDPGIIEGLRNKIRGASTPGVPEVEVGRRFDEDIPIVAVLERGQREMRVVEIRYPSGKEIKARNIEPLPMSNIEGIWYLNAYCRTAQAHRFFRLERILSARVTEERFEERPDIRLKTDFEHIDPRKFAATRAVIRFSPNIARWMEERPELDYIESHDDGSADYVLHYSDPSWAAKRVMQYLGEAVVIEPEDLRKEVRRMARSLLESYRKES